MHPEWCEDVAFWKGRVPPRGISPWVETELGGQGITVFRHSFQSG